ncbi:cyclin-D1-binding protein 1 homolog [Stegodyphus dumicola]|uniref:cyclin-D1-binding protein 1 homolog n=1 Tax=Stegodyphus dumicola TaxID=202533 RepID=UPI0015AFCF7D|nr:cyclin-D1-binding protein 1 homolog [Stegodyphus dumicola]
MAGSRSIRTILEKLEESLNIACEQLSEETPSRENADFDKDVFWANFSGATKLVSHEATKFCLAFGKEPLPSPEECQILANKTEESCLALLTVFFSLPKSKDLFAPDEEGPVCVCHRNR